MLECVAEIKYLGTAVINQSEELKIRLNPENAFYH